MCRWRALGVGEPEGTPVCVGLPHPTSMPDTTIAASVSWTRGDLRRRALDLSWRGHSSPDRVDPGGLHGRLLQSRSGRRNESRVGCFTGANACTLHRRAKRPESARAIRPRMRGLVVS